MGDFTGPPKAVIAVPFIVIGIVRGNAFYSDFIANQHAFSILGHLVFTGYPFHSFGGVGYIQ